MHPVPFNYPIARSNAVLAICLSFATAVQLHGQQPGETSRPQISDHELADRIEGELHADPGVDAQRIDVASQSGVVSLTGHVEHLLSKRRAARIAGTIRGVRAVVNQLKVKVSETRTEEEIREDVVAAIKGNPATEAFEVDVAVADGVVTLSGNVDSYQERELVVLVASGVRGAVDVLDHLAVEVGKSRSDSELAADIRSALRWCVHIDHNLVNVLVQEGQVELSGVVGSAAEKREAIGKSWVVGVRSVDATALRVERWARDRELRGDKWQFRSVNEVTATVEDALEVDPRVKHQDINVQVLGSVVTLLGQVDNLQAKRAAAQDARNTVGVTSVMNRLQVRPRQQRPDTEVAQAAREAIERDPYLNRFEMKVVVIDGVLTLYGEVDSRFEQQRATQVAADLRGVLEVRNRIAVQQPGAYLHRPYIDERVFDDAPRDYYEAPESRIADEKIRQAILEEYAWSPFVNAEQIEVSVTRGVATLNGTVETLAEARAATNNAYQGGATWVENKLKIATVREPADTPERK